jgi:uncharacterized protein
MAHLIRHLHRCMVAVLGALALSASAQTLQPVPALTARIIDNTGSLTQEQRQVLDDKLALIEKSDGTQIVVLMVPSTSPEDIESYANRVGNAWKIGRKEVGDGLLIVVAKNDRRMRIEVAKALEGAVPDVAAKHVIDEAITPRFKHEDFAGGINAGIDRLVELTHKEGLTTAEGTATQTDGWNEVASTLAVLYVLAGGLLTMGLGPAGFGAALLMSTTGAVGAAVGWFVSSNYATSLILGLIAYIYGGILIARWAGSSSGTSATTNTKSGSNDSSSWWSSSSSSDSSSGGSSFSSGGGGDFGGGGASGSW